jgi:hypothetical protein
MAMLARQYEPMLAMACVEAGDDMLIRGQVADRPQGSRRDANKSGNLAKSKFTFAKSQGVNIINKIVVKRK